MSKRWRGNGWLDAFGLSQLSDMWAKLLILLEWRSRCLTKVFSGELTSQVLQSLLEGAWFNRAFFGASPRLALGRSSKLGSSARRLEMWQLHSMTQSHLDVPPDTYRINQARYQRLTQRQRLGQRGATTRSRQLRELVPVLPYHGGFSLQEGGNTSCSVKVL